MKMKLLRNSIFSAALLFSGHGTMAADVTLYTSNSEDSVQAALDAVKTAAPDLNVNIIKGGSGTLLKRIQAESKKPIADIFWSSGFSTLANFKDNFAAYKSGELEAIPASLRGAGNLWTGTNVHVMVLMVNEKKLAGRAEPKSWADIFADEWKGKVAMSNPNSSSSAYAQLFGIWKLFGEDGVKKLAAATATQGSTSGVYKGVGQGEYAVGITMEYAAQRYVAGGQKEIKLVYPSEGTFLSPEGLVLVKGAPHPKAAAKLYDILLSKNAQEEIFSVSFRRPSRSDVDKKVSSSGLPSFSKIKIFEVDQAKAGEERKALLELWNSVKK